MEPSVHTRVGFGAKVVWLRDPDGNLLSIVQYA
jgi:hypothetical protein